MPVVPRVADAGRQGERHVEHVEQVAPAFGCQIVVAGVAVQPVVARPADQDVVPDAAAHHVAALTAEQPVAPVAAGQVVVAARADDVADDRIAPADVPLPSAPLIVSVALLPAAKPLLPYPQA